MSQLALRSAKPPRIKAARKPAKKTAGPPAAKRPAGRVAADWIAGIALGPAGARRYRLYRPPGSQAGDALPLLVMLHGCGQDADSFAASTRMNAVAARERFMVLYPMQERLANAQGCWNWFETRSGRAQGEVALIMAAIDQVCALHRVDRARVAICGLSAGASMAALVALRHPDRFKAVVMHSGVPPGIAQSSASALAAMRGRRIGAQALVASALADAAGLPPLLAIHGDGDHIVAPSNSRQAVLAWALAGSALAPGVGSVPAARADAGRRVQRGLRHPMRVVDFRRRGRNAVSLVEIERLGHAWSGGAPGQPFSDPGGPDASRLAWAFVAKCFREADAGRG